MNLIADYGSSSESEEENIIKESANKKPLTPVPSTDDTKIGDNSAQSNSGILGSLPIPKQDKIKKKSKKKSKKSKKNKKKKVVYTVPLFGTENFAQTKLEQEQESKIESPQIEQISEGSSDLWKFLPKPKSDKENKKKRKISEIETEESFVTTLTPEQEEDIPNFEFVVPSELPNKKIKSSTDKLKRKDTPAPSDFQQPLESMQKNVDFYNNSNTNTVPKVSPKKKTPAKPKSNANAAFRNMIFSQQNTTPKKNVNISSESRSQHEIFQPAVQPESAVTGNYNYDPQGEYNLANLTQDQTDNFYNQPTEQQYLQQMGNAPSEFQQAYMRDKPAEFIDVDGGDQKHVSMAELLSANSWVAPTSGYAGSSRQNRRKGQLTFLANLSERRENELQAQRENSKKVRTEARGKYGW